MVIYCGDDLEIAFKELTPAKVKPYAATYPRLLVTVRNNEDALTAQFARTVLFPDAFVQFLHQRPSKRKFPRICITGREALSADLGGRRSGVSLSRLTERPRCLRKRSPIKQRFARPQIFHLIPCNSKQRRRARDSIEKQDRVHGCTPLFELSGRLESHQSCERISRDN